MALAGCILALCAVAPKAFAQTQAPDDPYQQTIDDDLQAQAQQEMNSGQRENALVLLKELVRRDPRRAGAMLDVALLYCQLGERDLAYETLTHIESQYKVPVTIGKLITFYKANACMPAVARPKLMASIGGGVTSNANFGPSNPFVTFAPSTQLGTLVLAPSALAHSDQYLESTLQGELPIAALPGVSVLAGLSARQYVSLHDFDQRIATFGVAHQKIFTGGEVDNQLTADLLWLGSSVYQRNLEWHAAYWSPSTLLGTTQARAGLDFSVTDATYPGNSLYDSAQFALRAAFQAHIGERTTVLLFVGPAWNASYHGGPGGARRGYNAWLGLDYEMNRYGRLEAVLQQNTLNDAAPYDPVFFGDIYQRQTVQSASLRYSYPIADGWSAYTQLSAQRISDTISLFSYTVRTASMGLSWKY